MYYIVLDFRKNILVIKSANYQNTSKQNIDDGRPHFALPSRKRNKNHLVTQLNIMVQHNF